MTFYHTELVKINKEIYPKDYLTTQVIQSKRFIDHHFHEPLQLERIAKEAFISKFYFIRLFKSFYGYSPYQYLKSVRIESAKKFLYAGLSLTEVCESVGFDSVTSFIGLFKKATGSTPVAYQKKKSNSQERLF